MANTFLCRNCRKQSSTTGSTRKIRCDCERLIDVGEDQGAGLICTTKRDPSSSQEPGKIFHSNTKWPHFKPFGRKKWEYDGSDTGSLSGNKLCFSPRTPYAPEVKRRALLCGVAYKKQKFRLKGTMHDVNNMKDFLINKFDFPIDSIRILAEEENYPRPTKRNIQEALQQLVKDCKEGDSLVFYFSGHGLRQLDFNNDERDGFDETICPVDFVKEGMIVDNYINETVVRPLKRGVTLHAIIDSCHSGTILDLPNVYSTDTNKWEDNRPPSGVFKGTSGGKAICISACDDNQLAADTNAFSGKQMTGAMTYTLINAVRDNPNITYRSLLESMQKIIDEASKVKCFNSHLLTKIFSHVLLQVPQLSSSETFDVNTKFKL